MRILHTADLHIGKNVNGFSMISEQEEVLHRISESINDYDVDVLLIAGDIYDKRNPSDEAVRLFNDFILEVSQTQIPILIISGNHDSGIKLQFGSKLLKKQNVHIVGEYDGTLSKLTLEDQYGPINFYSLPFIRPADVRKYDQSVTTYHEAVKASLDREGIDYKGRNIIIAHQFFASGTEDRSESEIISVGGLDNVAYNVLENFDYAALGHLHKPQRLIKETIRYSGSPVIYSESEVNDKKSAVLIDIKEKGNLELSFIRLKTERKFRSITTSMKELETMEKSEDYIFLTLTDDGILDAISKARMVFPHVMSLNFDNARTQKQERIESIDVEDTSIDDLFKQFFNLQNNQAVNEKQEAIIKEVVERIDENASH